MALNDLLKKIFPLFMLFFYSCATQKSIDLIKATSTPYERTPAEVEQTTTCDAAIDQLLSGKIDYRVDHPFINLPSIPEAEQEIVQLKSGREIIVYKSMRELDETLPSYRDFLNNSIEVIVKYAGAYGGHVTVRVGDIFYGFNGVMDTSIKVFDLNHTYPKQLSMVFATTPDNILRLKKHLDLFFKSANDNNLPAYDLVSDFQKIHFDEQGKPYLNSDTIKLPNVTEKMSNNKHLLGKIVEKNGGYFVISDLGLSYPIEKRGNDYYMQTLNCTTIATYIMREFLNIKAIDFYQWPESMYKRILEKNVDELGVDAIIHY